MAGLGRDFNRIWAASTVSNVGDGLLLAAGPLLVVTLTDDPALVGGAVFAQQLPWLLFSLLSGAVVDRLDRRKLIVAVQLLRGAVLAALAFAVWAELATLWWIYLAFFLLGTAETLADNAFFSLLPSVVPRGALSRANARLVATSMIGNSLAGPPLGGFLFVVAAALPFGVNAATVVAAALLLATVRRRAIGPDPADPADQADPVTLAGPRRSLRADVGEGVRWLLRQPVLRLLAACICLMNITLMSAFAIYVLYARERLGLGEVGYGLLITASAVGGLLGSAVVHRLELRFGMGTILRVGLIVETLTHLSLALTRSPWVAGATMAVFGVHAAIWGVLAMSARQRIVPDGLLGRVNSVYALFSVGGSALGALLGGWVAQGWGITAPFWGAFVAMAVMTAVAWRRLGTIPRSDRSEEFSDALSS
jgi:MFS family permease